VLPELKMIRGPLALAASLCVLVWVPVAMPASAPRVLCTLQPGQATLAPDALRGLAHHLRQYPDVALATPGQRRAASRLLARIRDATARWRDVRQAAASGFDVHLGRHTRGDQAVGYLHAEHRRYSHDGHVLDPSRPESLIYATEPGRKPTLVGAMFSVPRGALGPTPGGPIGRWHSHLVCRHGDKRGLAPPATGGCPAGSTLTQGSEMLHVWFTADLRSAFAVHAPVRELCRDALLTPKACRAGPHRRGM
jgi:hypothetical protein